MAKHEIKCDECGHNLGKQYFAVGRFLICKDCIDHIPNIKYKTITPLPQKECIN